MNYLCGSGRLELQRLFVIRDLQSPHDIDQDIRFGATEPRINEEFEQAEEFHEEFSGM